MTETLREKAVRYFSGEVVVVSLTGDRLVHDPQGVRNSFRLPPEARVVMRSEYTAGDATLFFAGHSVRQRKLIGVDWVAEGRAFRGLELVEGSVPDADDETGVLISEATASRLGSVRAGDDLLLLLSQSSGQRNSLNLVVRGIFRDTSFFGYASYLSLSVLNSAMGRDPQAVSVLGVVGAGPDLGPQELVGQLKAAGLDAKNLLTRKEWEDSASDDDAAPLGVITLGANLKELEDVIGALSLVGALTTFGFLGVLIIGVANTYRMVVFERTKELGTLRALGMQRSRVLALIFSEAGILATGSLLIGSLLGSAALGIASQLVWPDSPVSSLVLWNLRLRPHADIVTWLGQVTLVYLATLAGALAPSLRASRVSPLESLGKGK